MTPTKIAHIATSDLSLYHLLLNQMTSLREAGYDVVGISSPGPDVAQLEGAGIRHVAVAMSRAVTPLADLVSLWRLYRVLRHERFTLVHTHTPKAELLGRLAAGMAGVPIIIDTFRGIYYRDKEMHPWWRRLFIEAARLGTGQADSVLCQSREAMQMAVSEGICASHKLSYLGNGIDLKRFQRTRVDGASLDRLRRELKIGRTAPVVGFVGRLVREKGVLDLLETARLVRRRIPTARFLLIGPQDNEKNDAIRPESIQANGRSEGCSFVGLRHDMPELYALMDVFTLPSHRESFPRSPMEASAMGVPCIVTDVPGCREVVEHGQNGWLVPKANAPALAESIVSLLSDQARSRRMSQAGRRIAASRFDEQIVFAKVQAEYARMLRAKKLPVPTQAKMLSA